MPLITRFVFDSAPFVKPDVLFLLHLARANERLQVQKPDLSYSLVHISAAVLFTLAPAKARATGTR
jgi:hypothetical protein